LPSRDNPPYPLAHALPYNSFGIYGLVSINQRFRSSPEHTAHKACPILSQRSAPTKPYPNCCTGTRVKKDIVCSDHPTCR
jgi:hypothetical protein